MPIIGDKVRFDPFGECYGFGSDLSRGNIVTGTVVFVHYEHKWFSVEYGDPKQRTSFNFCDIGKSVNVIG